MFWDQYLAQNKDTPARTVDGVALVITPHDSTLHNLNETATFIWDRADGTRTLAQIATEFLQTYQVDEQTLRTDAEAFVQQAVQLGLMTAEEEPEAAA